MSPERRIYKGRLRRLAPEHYRGHAWFHWTMSFADRARGWLDALHHARLREALCHALAREDLVCAGYCLMPDHAHFVIGGLRASSDQRVGMRAFRKSWNGILESGRPPVSLMLQPYDHVFTDEGAGTR